MLTDGASEVVICDIMMGDTPVERICRMSRAGMSQISVARELCQPFVFLFCFFFFGGGGLE